MIQIQERAKAKTSTIAKASSTPMTLASAPRMGAGYQMGSGRKRWRARQRPPKTSVRRTESVGDGQHGVAQHPGDQGAGRRLLLIGQVEV